MDIRNCNNNNDDSNNERDNVNNSYGISRSNTSKVLIKVLFKERKGDLKMSAEQEI